MAIGNVRNSVSICVENGSKIYILSAEGEDMFSQARIVQDRETGERYLEVAMDGISDAFYDSPLHIAIFGEVDTVPYEQQLVPSEDDSFDELDIQEWPPINGFPGSGITKDEVQAMITEALANMPIYCGEFEDVPIINFTIDAKPYQAVYGMTWGEWVNSEYNTGYIGDMFVLDGEDIYLVEFDSYVLYHATHAIDTDQIEADFGYQLT